MPIKGTRLPGVGELRALLDYGDSSLERSKFFHEDCRFFIRHYVDAEGNAGSHFHDRTSKDDLEGIHIMTEAFLEAEAHGEYWWPSNPDHRNANRLQYSTSKQQYDTLDTLVPEAQLRANVDALYSIMDTMELLFLRINVQYQSNTRYKSKNGINSVSKPATCNGQDSSRNQSVRGSSVNDPIDLENAHHQATVTQDRADGAGKGLALDTSRWDHAAAMRAQPSGQLTQSSPTGEPREADPYEGPWSPDLPDHPNAAQTSRAGARANQSKSTAAEEPPAASSRMKRAPPKSTQRPCKKPKVKITTRRHSSYKPERPPQRKSSRKRSFFYDSLDFSDQGVSQADTAQRMETVAETAREEEEASEQNAQVVEEEATVGAAPATAPVTTLVPESSSAPMPVPATASDATQPEPLPVLAPMQQEVIGSGNGQTLQADLERDVELALARRQKAPEAPSPSDNSTANHAVNTEISPIEAFLFSRVHALSPSGTAEKRSAQVLEHLHNRARVPDAPMGFVHSPGLQFLPAERQTSPPPPEMGQHEWIETVNVPLQSTESAREMSAAAAPDHTAMAHISTRSPEAIHSRPSPERCTTQTRTEHSLARSPEAAEPKKQESMASKSEKSSAGPQLQPAAARSELRLIVRSGPRLHETWKHAPPLKDLTMARIKREIPLQLSPEFRGFKFTFVGAGERHRFEIENGDETEFVHLKLDVEEVMEDLEEKNQGKGEYLGFQLRIEELRDTGAEMDRAET